MPLEVEDKDDLKLVFVGKFRFLKSSFDKANQYLTNASEKHPNYLVIDELGKLELNNEGLHGAAAILINNYGADKNKHLILVVRRSLVEPILAHYKIQDHRLISKDDLREDCFA